MSRFYHTNVQNRSGELFAQGLMQAFQNYRQGKRQQQEDRLAAEDRSRAQEGQDLSLALQGIFRGQAPAEQPMVMPGVAMGTQFGQIPTPAIAPKRFSQLTPTMFRDRQVVETNQRDQFQQMLNAALAKSQADVLADPEGRAVDLGYKRALTGQANATALAAGQRAEAAPAPRRWVPQSMQEALAFEEGRARIGARHRAPTATQLAQGKPKPLPMPAVDKLIGIDDMMSLATDVQQSLGSAVRNGTNATGRAFGVLRTPNWAKNLAGMGGQEGAKIRSKIGNLFATVAKERGGSALSEAELDLLESYVPNENEDETTALRKANQFVQTLRRMKENKLKAYREYGGYETNDQSAAPNVMAGLPNPEY